MKMGKALAVQYIVLLSSSALFCLLTSQSAEALEVDQRECLAGLKINESVYNQCKAEICFLFLDEIPVSSSLTDPRT